MAGNLHHTLDFLRDLRNNNERTWFNANKKRYEQARAAFESIVSEVIGRFDGIDDLGGITAGDAMFRINRDVRFSPDKSPYKTAMGALLGTEGRKSTGRSYYLQIQPDGGSLLAGGLYAAMPDQLAAMRQAIAADARPLQEILAAPDFVKYFKTMDGEQVKTTPKGYSKDHPAIDLLRYKQFMATHPLTDEQVTGGDLVDHVLDVYRAMKPFVTYLYDVLGTNRA
jgi:uncharacterized protein (TIGR02453 family)